MCIPVPIPLQCLKVDPVETTRAPPTASASTVQPTALYVTASTVTWESCVTSRPVRVTTTTANTDRRASAWMKRHTRVNVLICTQARTVNTTKVIITFEGING